MKVQYDTEVDVVHIILSNEPVDESGEEEAGIIFDYDKKGNIVGMEILDVSGYLSAEELSSVHFDIEKVLSNKKNI